MALRKIHNTYYVYFRDLDGSLKTRSLHTTDKAMAEDLHRRFMLMLQSKRGEAMLYANFPDQFRNKPITSIAPPIETQEGEHVKGSIALAKMFECAQKKTAWKNPDRMLKTWEHFTSNVSVKYADEVTPRIALAYLEKFYGKSSGKTFNNHKTALNTIFRLCLVESNLQQSPFAVIANRRLTEVQHYRPLTEEEFIKAFEAASEPWKTASLISWFTAMRRETCFRLAWEHIDTSDQSITIMPGKTARFGRAVYIPIHEQLWEHLISLPRPKSDKTPILSQFPFIANWEKATGRKKTRLTYYVGLLHSLGIKDTADGKAGFHSIRSSFITQCDEANVERRATKGVAGQVHDSTTDLYSRDKETAKQILRLKRLKI